MENLSAIARNPCPHSSSLRPRTATALPFSPAELPFGKISRRRFAVKAALNTDTVNPPIANEDGKEVVSAEPFYERTPRNRPLRIPHSGKTSYLKMKTDSDLGAGSELLSSDLKDVGNAMKNFANHAIKLGGLGFGTSFLKWVACFAAMLYVIRVEQAIFFGSSRLLLSSHKGVALLPLPQTLSLSLKTLLESDRYVCEICNQGKIWWVPRSPVGELGEGILDGYLQPHTQLS